MKESDKYLKIVEWSDEDNCYIGTCPSLMFGGVHGDNEAKVYKELCEVVEEVIELYKEDGDELPEPTAGRSFSGKFILRVGSELHQTLFIEALRNNESLNAYCVNVLAKKSCPRLPSRRSPARRKTVLA
jgi:predicted HicB family RNase H-like nuclease